MKTTPLPENSSGLKPNRIPVYDGNRTNYPAWRTAVLDIFRMDWLLFGYDDTRAFMTIFGAMKKKVLKKAAPFFKAGGSSGTRKPEDFIEFFDRINLDPMRVTRATEELHTVRMGEGQRWPDFFTVWSNTLTEGRGDFWDDYKKISMLRNS